MSNVGATGVRGVGCAALLALAWACNSGNRQFDNDENSAGSSGAGSDSTASGGSAAGEAGSTGGGQAEAGTGGTAPSMAGESAGGEGPSEHACAMDPCLNGGICSDEGGRAVCTCDSAYEGEHCENSVDDCADSPCQNSGTCIDGAGTYTCSCPSGFSGEHCERAVSKCEDDPCLNDATCADQANSYTCTCVEGFEGTHCEVNVDDCAGNPCQNGAACVDGVNSHTCECKAGYEGTSCETNINDCANHACQNSATCVDGVDSYTCQCRMGFTGNRCETNIDDCASNPCENSGTCVDGVSSYTCSCTDRYTGPKCEYLEVKVVPSDFLNGAYWTTGTALSNDGKVLLMNLSNGSGNQGIARLVDFDSANLVTLGAPFLIGAGFGINADGSTITGSGVADDRDQAIKIVGMSTSLLNLTPIGWSDPYSAGLDVSADGSAVVGRLSSGGGTTTFYCKTGQNCREVPMDAGGIVKSANSVNGDGTIVVGSTFPADPNNGTGTAWRWVNTAAKATVLPLSAATWSLPAANGISRNGLVVVGEVAINGVSHAVRWSGGSFTPTDLGTGRALGTNADGSVTVGVDNSNVPIVWLGTTRHTLASLLGTNPDLSGATLRELVAVSDDGKVVGGTVRIGGNPRAFMARLP